MTDQQMERLANALLQIGTAVAAAAELARSLCAYMEAKAMGVDADSFCDDGEQDPFEVFIRTINGIGDDKERLQERLQELTAMVEDLPPPITHKKMPRPPKCLGPVNKVNYTSIRPPRRARSNCRTIKRR